MAVGGLELRPLGPSDEPLARDLLTRAFRDYVRQIRPDPPGPFDWLPQRLAGGFVQALYDHDTPVGILNHGPRRGPNWPLEMVGVVPEARGKDLAVWMLARVYAAAREAGAEAVTLSTTQKMTRLVAFYRRQGFHPTHYARPAHGRDPHRRVFMRRPL